MNRRSVSLAAVGATAMVAQFTVHCGEKAPPTVETASLDGAVARVGDIAITPVQVAWVAAGSGISPRQAMDELVGDALASLGALARGFDSDRAVAWERTAVLARQVPLRFAKEAAQQGPPTDDELASVRVVHAVVMRSPTLREEDALTLARSIRQAVSQARSADEFVQRADAVPHVHASVVAQNVGPFAADGVDATGGEVDAGFVAAAFALRTPFEVSPIVATPFGWHVLQLVERRAPSDPAEVAARREALAGAVQTLRSRMRLDALLRTLRSTAHVETAVSADEIMARAMASP